MVNVPENALSCEGCRYAQPVVTKVETVILECYRYPGTLVVIGDELFQVHPDADYRCGEYRKPQEEQIAGLKELLEKLRAHPLTPAPEE